MSVLSAEEVARHCHQAGFNGEALVTIVAIAKGESGFDAGAVGDVSLQDEVWGPSIGLLQIRSLHEEKGTGGTRDELANLDPGHNAESAFEISSHGHSFRPWSVFTADIFRRFLDDVRPACQAVDGTVSSAGTGAGSPPDEPVLRQGSTGDAVGRLQELLDVVGFHQPEDGFKVFGASTREAVKDYQKSRGLDVDGVVGKDTRKALKTGAGPV
ncbi:MAG TPA: peptidoglycan-binding protein [Acidimicrobiales bacterium]